MLRMLPLKCNHLETGTFACTVIGVLPKFNMGGVAAVFQPISALFEANTERQRPFTRGANLPI